jgi:hypothetical protein
MLMRQGDCGYSFPYLLIVDMSMMSAVKEGKGAHIFWGELVLASNSPFFY